MHPTTTTKTPYIHQTKVIRRVEHAAHVVAHPMDHARWRLQYWPKQMMHRAVDRCCCTIQ